MTTAKRRLDTLDLSPGAILAGHGRGDSRAGARYRLILALAGLAALVAWGLSHELSDARSGGEQAGQAASAAARQPNYDGHGKWGGYMPQ
jgi:hypothetical protein